MTKQHPHTPSVTSQCKCAMCVDHRRKAMDELLTFKNAGERDPDALIDRVVAKHGIPRYIVRHALDNLSAIDRLLEGTYGRGCEDADEYCEAIAKVFEKIREGAAFQDAQQYLKRAIRNECINAHRKAHTACVSLDAISIQPSHHDFSTTSYEELQHCASGWLQERGYEALAAVAQDPDRLHKDIARELGISPSAFSRRVTNERSRLEEEEQDFRDSLPPHLLN